LNYAHLGRTGLKLRRLAGRDGEPTDEADSFSIRDEALEAGINFLDTADVYDGPAIARRGEGFGVSEEIIGCWLGQAGGARWTSRLAPGRTIADCHTRPACEAMMDVLAATWR
jgi:aryl-alcohol dehydrogenase-like predicted oxidoreductase